MARIANIYGGGAQTNTNGLAYERDTDLLQLISEMDGFTVQDNSVYKNGSLIAEHFSKNRLYKDFLTPRGVDYKDYISSRLLPDDAFIVGEICYIIEKKYQEGHGSVDEKLQTFQFKKEQYQKIFSPVNIEVKFYYLLSDWFRQSKYRDVLAFIQNNGSEYFFIPNELIAHFDL